MGIQVVQQNIVEINADAIVNAANNYLAAGSGVCGAIFNAAGIELTYECTQLGRCETGAAVITRGYTLAAKYIIHAVGPVYNKDIENAPMLLRSAYNSALRLAVENNLRSIAFPCISTGVYGYPQQQAAEIAVDTAKNFLKTQELEIIFCCFNNSDFRIYTELLK